MFTGITSALKVCILYNIEWFMEEYAINLKEYDIILKEFVIICFFTEVMCYHFLDALLSWEDAAEECRYLGGFRGDGDLASINSYQEQVFIQGMEQVFIQGIEKILIHLVQNSEFLFKSIITFICLLI